MNYFVKVSLKEVDAVTTRALYRWNATVRYDTYHKINDTRYVSRYILFLYKTSGILV